MKIIKLIPRGFCSGVTNALSVLDQAIKENPDKPVYSLGWIIHNENVVKEYQNKGVIFLDDQTDSREHLLKNIKNSNAVVVFSAHGTPQYLFDFAKAQGFVVYDATCQYVDKIHQIIHEKMHDYQIIFIGKKNHPESIATLSISPDIIFIDVDEANKEQKYKQLKIDSNKQYYLLNQTTISLFDYYTILQYFKQNYDNIVFDNEICQATTKRQTAVIEMDPSIQLLIVVGDKRSNNSNQLRNVALKKGVQSYLVNKAEEVKKEWFDNIEVVGLTAGTSAPREVINTVIEKIKSFNLV